jgi:hypothetical protein
MIFCHLRSYYKRYRHNLWLFQSPYDSIQSCCLVFSLLVFASAMTSTTPHLEFIVLSNSRQEECGR